MSKGAAWGPEDAADQPQTKGNGHSSGKPGLGLPDAEAPLSVPAQGQGS